MFCQNNLNNARLVKNWVTRAANSAQLYIVNITKHKHTNMKKHSLLYKMPSVTVLHSNHLIRQLMYRLICRFLCLIWSVISLIETSQQIPTPLGPEWSCGCHDCPGDALRLSDEFLSKIDGCWVCCIIRQFARNSSSANSGLLGWSGSTG